MFYAKAIDREMFVKKLPNGEACFYSTRTKSEAAQFETETEALEWANGLFRGKGEVVEVAGPKHTPANAAFDQNKAVKYEGVWMSAREAAMWEEHNA